MKMGCEWAMRERLSVSSINGYPHAPTSLTEISLGSSCVHLWFSVWGTGAMGRAFDSKINVILSFYKSKTLLSSPPTCLWQPGASPGSAHLSSQGQPRCHLSPEQRVCVWGPPGVKATRVRAQPLRTVLSECTSIARYTQPGFNPVPLELWRGPW